MNKENILTVANAIEKEPHLFDIKNFHTCIVGFARRSIPKYYRLSDINGFDLDDETLEQLIEPLGFTLPTNSLFFTGEQAVRTLRNLAQTGQVNWSV